MVRARTTNPGDAEAKQTMAGMSAVRVATRIRPLNKKEKEVATGSKACQQRSKTELIIRGKRGEDTQFTFDHVYGPRSKQDEIYQSSVSPLVENFLSG